MMPTYKEGTDANNGRYAIAIGERQRTTPDKRAEGVISQGIGACQKLSGGSILDLSKLQDPRTLGYLLIFGLYSKPIAYC